MVQRVRRFYRRLFIVFSLIFSASTLVTLFADGLPGEYLATQRWRFLFSSESPVSNPALINEANYLSLRYALSKSMNEFLMQEIGFVYPLGLYQSFGLTAILKGVDAYPATKGAEDDFALTGDNINDQQYFFMGSYAWNFWSRLTLGANVNLSMYPFNNNSMGFGFDAGMTYRLLNNPVIGSHLLGVSLQNAMTKFTNSEEKYPRNLRVSLNSTYWEKRIVSGFDFALKDIAVDNDEYIPDSTAKTEWDLNAKLGFWILRLANLYGVASLADDGLEAWGFAVGFNIPSVNNGRDVSLLFQYLTLPENDFGSYTLYAKGDIGKHREEVYARKMAKMANVSPNNLYLKALEMYSQGNYWDAFFLFSQLFVEFPDFFKNDWVSYFLSSCQENLDMRTTAEEAYKKTKSQFSRSAVIPYVDLGMMRGYYRDGDIQGVNKQFNELNKLGVPDSIKFHGYYIMGETEMKQGNNTKAKQLFEMIPENHPDYVYAQHSGAIIAAATNNIENAVLHLENCIQAQVTTNGQKEIVNRSYVFLGYIFYEELTKEEGTLAKAVTALRMVPKTSFYYTDALLGLGWTGLKARQWNDCLSASQELASIAKNTVVKAEGTLLQAYSNMMQKNYGPAVALLSGISTELENYKVNQESELATKKQEYNEVRGQYTDLAKSAYDLVTTRQSSLVEKQIDSLHVLQKQYKDQINSYVSYTDNYNRMSFFNRSYDAVKEDIDYALAKAQKYSGTSKSVKETGKINKETNKIDDELERLKKELEKEQKKP
jgi:tetratricopeptide (TPR) repeat protein